MWSKMSKIPEFFQIRTRKSCRYMEAMPQNSPSDVRIYSCGKRGSPEGESDMMRCDPSDMSQGGSASGTSVLEGSQNVP